MGETEQGDRDETGGVLLCQILQLCGVRRPHSLISLNLKILRNPVAGFGAFSWGKGSPGGISVPAGNSSGALASPLLGSLE